MSCWWTDNKDVLIFTKKHESSVKVKVSGTTDEFTELVCNKRDSRKVVLTLIKWWQVSLKSNNKHVYVHINTWYKQSITTLCDDAPSVSCSHQHDDPWVQSVDCFWPPAGESVFTDLRSEAWELFRCQHQSGADPRPSSRLSVWRLGPPGLSRTSMWTWTSILPLTPPTLR